jgi:hypothetical protein
MDIRRERKMRRIRRLSSVIFCVIMAAAVFSAAVPTGVGSSAEVDAGGPYGTQEDPYCVGDYIVFQADIIGGDEMNYKIRWDITSDGVFDGPGSAPEYWGDYGESDLPYVFMDPFIGQATVEAWDGSTIGGAPAIITDTADVWVINCPIRLLEELIILIDSFEPDDFSKPNRQNTLINKVNAILNNIDMDDLASICAAIDKLKNDILPKTDGESPPPEWVTDPVAQQELEDKINEVIEALQERAEALGGCGG